MSDEHFLDDAADLFIKRLVRETRNGTIDGFEAFFEGGPAGRTPRSNDVARYEWFRSLGEADKEKVMEVVREAVDGALFNALMLLDQEDPFGEDQQYDFAVYLQVYDDDEAHETDRPSRRSEKLNRPEHPPTLRDRFLDALAELHGGYQDGGRE